MTYFSVTISFVALLVAVYGIFERQRAAYSGLRVRLTELLASLEELSIEQLEYEDHGDQPATAATGRDTRGAVYGYASRRALLTYQALDLLERLRTSYFGSRDAVSAAEYGSLATSLRWCGDLQEARRQWERSLATSGYTPDLVLAASNRGLGDLLFELGDDERARQCFTQAAAHESEDTMTGQWQLFDTYLGWLQHEMRLEHGRPEVPARGAYGVASDPRWGPDLIEPLRAAAATTAFVDGEYRELGLDDLLSRL